jgi:hypothetical protein
MIDHFTINKRLISGVLTKYRTTFEAFCELLTNAIHAGATNIVISIEASELLGSTADVSFKSITVRDDGSGVSKREFKSKILDIATESKMAQGGKGVGRFAAIQLGSRMEIETVAKDPLETKTYRTRLVVDTKDWQSGSALDQIPLEVDHTEISEDHQSYYQIAISNFYSSRATKEEKHLRMLKCFSNRDIERAIFERYTDVILRGRTRFSINGNVIVATDHVIGEIESRSGGFKAHDGAYYPLEFQYMQVKAKENGHKIFLRVANGDISTVAHSYDYTGDIPADNQWIAFVDSPYFGADTDVCRGLFMSDLNPDTEIVTSAIKESVDSFFTETYATYYDFTSKLKSDAAYPYRKKSASSLTRASVFNQLAYCIEEKHHLLKRRSDLRNLVYGLVDRSLNQREFGELISDVLKIEDSMAARFNTLLQQVDLEDVVAFCDEVKSKQQFLDFLHKLNYGELAKNIGERAQLHKIVQRHLWIFGEEYNDCPILFSDKNLRNNLLELRNDYFNYQPNEEDENLDTNVPPEALEITDLFFFNEKILQADQKEVMIVELKAPRVKLGDKELRQAKKYALRLQEAGVFPEGLKYKIILIGSDVMPIVRQEYGQRGKKRMTLVHETTSPKQIEIWIMKWSDLIEENRRKLTYLGNNLATKDREVQEYWTAEFGDVPTKELFSTMQDSTERKDKGKK